MTVAAEELLISSAPRCAWCGARSDQAEGRLVVCRACGSATTFPPPDDAELDAAYATWYRPAAGRFSGGGDVILRRSRGMLARRLDRRAPPGPILDVGAGDGVLLDALRARGREAVGLERHSRRADIREADIEAFDEREGQWAAVVFWHSLEHLREPGEAIRRARTLLVPGGLLVLAVPNYASWQARWLGGDWLALDLPRHLVHLRAPALIEHLRHEGLAIERVSFWRGGQVVFGWLHGLVLRVPGHVDLYDAIRRADARSAPLSGGARRRALLAAVALLPVALTLSLLEVSAHAGGSVYVEARRK